jgi:uncharacterized membrane protein HdeD (DUF308 family)
MLLTTAHDLAGNWWVVALRGFVAIAFGVLTLLVPQITLAALVLLFGAFALVDGVLSLMTAIRAPRQRRGWWTFLIVGVAGIAAGLVTFLDPVLTEIALLYFIAAWAIVRGVFEFLAAIELRRNIANEWLLALSGLLSVAFGLLIAVDPGSGAVAIAWLIGLYAIVAGTLLLGVAWRLRGLSELHIGINAFSIARPRAQQSAQPPVATRQARPPAPQNRPSR